MPTSKPITVHYFHRMSHLDSALEYRKNPFDNPHRVVLQLQKLHDTEVESAFWKHVEIEGLPDNQEDARILLGKLNMGGIIREFGITWFPELPYLETLAHFIVSHILLFVVQVQLMVFLTTPPKQEIASH